MRSPDRWLDRRISVLEQRAVIAAPADAAVRAAAMRQLFDVIEAAYSSSWNVAQPYYTSWLDKAADAWRRIANGEPSHVDIAALATFPPEALAVFGMTAEEALQTIVEIRDKV